MSDPPAMTDAELAARIMDIVAKDGAIPRESVTPDATMESLGLTSMDLVMILTGLEEAFDIYIPVDGPLAECKDMHGFIAAISAHIRREGKDARKDLDSGDG